MKLVRILALGMLVALSSCATYRLIPQESDNVTLKRNRGASTLLGLSDTMAVVVSAQVHEDLIYFQLIVRNVTDHSISVDDSRIKLTERAPHWIFPADVKVYDAEEYLAIRQKQIRAGQVMMAVAAGIAAMEAGRSTTYTYGYYREYGYGRRSYYRGFGTYSYTTYTYDSARAAYERDIAFSNVRDYVNGTNRELDYLRDTLFFPTDIDVNGEYYGLVVAGLGDPTDSLMKLSVDFGKEHFDFTFQKSKMSYDG